MVLCLIVGCSNKTGKSKSGREKKIFFRVPRVITSQGELVEELTSTRRRLWISAISRDDLTEEKLENDRVCSQHFASGEPAKEWDRHNVDWVPTLNLGHDKLKHKLQVGEAEKVAKRAERAANRRKRRQEIIEKEIPDKLKKINEPGKPVKDIFQHVTQSELIDEAIDIDPEPVVDQMHADSIQFLAKETQTIPTYFQDAETQTSDFEYSFKETKIQPFTDDYFDSDDKVCFYTGLPGLDSLKTILQFVEPHVNRKSKTLTAFQELVMVLMKLRLNVPQQDLAYRFDVSQSTVSRVFLSWMTVMDIRLTPLIAWPEREELWRTMPRCFQYAFEKKTTIIIDCFEIFIERPSNLLARAQTFSNY